MFNTVPDEDAASIETAVTPHTSSHTHLLQNTTLSCDPQYQWTTTHPHTHTKLCVWLKVWKQVTLYPQI